MPNSQKRLQRLKAKGVAKPPYRNVDYFNQIKSDQPDGAQDFIRKYAESNFIQYLPYIIAGLLVVFFVFYAFFTYSGFFDPSDIQNTSDPISSKFIIIYWSIVGAFILLGPITQWVGPRRWFLLFTSHREITTNEYHAIAELRKLKPAFNTFFEEQKQKTITKKIYADLMLRYLDGEVAKKLQHDRQSEIAKEEAKIQQHQKAKKLALSTPLSAENKKETSG